MSMEMTKGSAPNTMAEAQPVETPRFVPAVDIYETPEEYVVMAEMPGCDPKGIDVQFENGELSIHGRALPRLVPATGWLAREFGIGDYARTFNVTESIETEKISAEYEQGILTLHLPKVETAKPRRIEVRAK
jgi:HSP20 family protein